MRARALIASPPWTGEEDERLRALAGAGVRPGIIAKKIGGLSQPSEVGFTGLEYH
jgi:hypothetical protein